MIAWGEVDRRQLAQGGHQGEEAVHLRLAGGAVNHIPREKNHVRILSLNFVDQPGVVPAELLAVEIGDADNPHRCGNRIQSNRVVHRPNAGGADDHGNQYCRNRHGEQKKNTGEYASKIYHD